MGTRSLTIFLDEYNDNEIVAMYRQFDGYPEGHGEELYELLKDVEMVNGIPMGANKHFANGMGCLAAQVVAHFKDGAGGFYLYPAKTRDTGEEYIYTLYVNRENKLCMKIEDVYENEILYNDLVSEFNSKG